jgi:uncharacterized membrane protein YcaP (DUF421 family)
MTPELSSVEVQEPGMPQILISDGKICKKKLEALGLNEQWLRKELAARGSGSIEDTFIFTRDECGRVYYVAKEKKSA